MLGRPLKPLAQHRILRGHPYRARIEVALSHHHAPARDERRGGKPELVRPEQRRKRHVAPRLELPVGLKSHAAAQLVEDEHLMRLGQTELPRRARVLDR